MPVSPAGFAPDFELEPERMEGMFTTYPSLCLPLMVLCFSLQAERCEYLSESRSLRGNSVSGSDWSRGLVGSYGVGLGYFLLSLCTLEGSVQSHPANLYSLFPKKELQRAVDACCKPGLRACAIHVTAEEMC